MSWDIHPFVGLGPILFGMTEQDVAALAPLVGPITARHVDPDGTVNEHRGLALPTVSYQGGKVCYLAAGRRVADVLWQGTDVFKEQPKAVLRALETASGGAETALGTVRFRQLGLDTTGFYLPKQRRFFRPASRDQDDRCISLFDRALYAKSIEELGPRFQAISFLDP